MTEFEGGGLSRRRLFEVGGQVAVGAALAGPLGLLGDERRVAWAASAAEDMPAPDVAALLLNRAAYGGSSAELARVRAMGVAAWVDEQLAYERLDDSGIEGPLAAGLPTLAMPFSELVGFTEHVYRVPDALNAAMFYRQTFSPRQLYESMVDFWSDHFSIYQYMENGQWFKTVDDREVIRKHALGRFKDLLTASATSPGMLHYLNNDENVKGRPNENYARELMELHTLGVAVDGVPYSEMDVQELARCLTGWTWQDRSAQPKYGEYTFIPGRHDDGAKQVLGVYFPARAGAAEVNRVLDMLCANPATARFLAVKLIRRFVTDDPVAQVPALVDRVAATYTSTDGDIRAMVRTVLTSAEFASSFSGFGGRLARPLDLAVRMLRVTGVPQASLVPSLAVKGTFKDWYYALVGWDGLMNRMGHIPFGWLTPDGYPDVKEKWGSAAGFLTRWNMGLDLANGRLVTGFVPAKTRPANLTTADAVVDYWTETLIHRPLLPADRNALLAAFTDNGHLGFADAVKSREADLVALLLDSPYFQWR